jgi:nucleoside-diphosphate-sugar epimerase
MRIVITGAAGKIGRQIAEEMSETHDLCLIDRRPVSGRASIVADLRRPPSNAGWKNWFNVRRSRWSRVFENAGVVIHLAANPQVQAAWSDVLHDNIETTWHVLEAAATYKVPRVVFASSNWAVKAFENKLSPACYQPGGPKIPSEIPPYPSQPYGLSKAFGELAGRMFVEEGKLDSFIAVRIGNYGKTPSREQSAAARWIDPDDIRSLFRRCAEANIKGFHVVYGVSGQNTSPYDLSHTCQLLSWKPGQVPLNSTTMTFAAQT